MTEEIEVQPRVITIVEFLEEKYGTYEKKESFLGKWWLPITWILISIFLLV